MNGLSDIKQRLSIFKQRFYRQQLVVGLISFLIANALVFLFIFNLEDLLWLGSIARMVLLFLLIGFLGASFYIWLFRPIAILIRLRAEMSDEEAAKAISDFFPEIKDQLINILQLQGNTSSELVVAAIEAKTKKLSGYRFSEAIDFVIIKKYLLALSAVMLIFALFSFINPSALTKSPQRILQYSQEFEKEAPFSFLVRNPSLATFRGENLTLQVDIAGDILPEKVRIYANDRLLEEVKLTQSSFEYELANLQEDKEIYFESSGFQSVTHKINILDRPELAAMYIQVEPPRYTGEKPFSKENTGNIRMPEGSRVHWKMMTTATDSALFSFSEHSQKAKQQDTYSFALQHTFSESTTYSIDLYNAYGQNESTLEYHIEVIPDEYPSLSASFFLDSVSYQSLSIAGAVADDYGIRSLTLQYRKSGTQDFNTIPIAINPEVRGQNYFAVWNLDSLEGASGSVFEVKVVATDNDAINRFKKTQSRTYVLKIPGEEEIREQLSEKEDNIISDLSDSEKKTEEISDRLKTLSDRLKTQQKVDWQEKKLAQELVKDRKKLSEQIKQLQEQHQDLQKSNNRFQDQSKELQEKNEKLQQLLNDLMDEETMELYKELQKMMEKEASSEEMTQQLDKLQRNEQNLERDLERAVELLKRLKIENELEQTMQQLSDLSEKQRAASKQPENEDVQKDINDEFEKFREQMDEIQQMNQELKRPEPMQDFEMEERQIAKELRDIMEEMQQQAGEDENQSTEKENGDSEKTPKENAQRNSQIQQKQQDAAEQMSQLSKKLSKMQGGMQMEMMQANLDQLRDILDNLIKLSYHQEDIMIEMREVSQSDPRFLELSQQQLTLKDDAQVIQDSLLSLASRVVQLSSFITREIESINKNIDESLDFLKDRNRNRALSSQQFSMTSINNLALLLDDTMQQMQMAMAESMGKPSGQQQKEGQGLPSLQEMQDALGDKINELKGAGKEGRELSEQLARLAAEQEMIRKQMERIKESQNGKPGNEGMGESLQQAIDLMERNEIDLVNKRLTRQLINRQKQIQTRMLEADKAQRKQETEEQREAQRPTIISRDIPADFKKYLQIRKKETELLKTVPIELNPFYKKEVNDYFRRISSDPSE